MITIEPLYLKDCYMKEFDATVKSVKNDKFVVLDTTAFYPNAGGQPWDEGVMINGDKEYKVVFVGKFGDIVSHEVNAPGLKEGDKVHCRIDWDRRYRLMKMHTAAHVLSRVMFDEVGANTAGNQLGIDRSRIDFTLDQFDREKIPGWIEKSNEIIAKGLPVKKSNMSREETDKIPGFAGPSPHLVKGFDTLRVVDIVDFDCQPCGGTHLDNLSEIGKMKFVKAENKGKNNRRIYYTIEP